MKRSIAVAGALIGATLFQACDGYDRPTTAPHASAAVSATALDPRGVKRVITGAKEIEPAVDAFRALVGEPLNAGATGPQPGGRRQINWDGVPDPNNNTDAFPPDFFKRQGAIFSTPGFGFRNSDKDFSDVNPTYAVDFDAFSAPKTFSPRGSNVMDVTFRLAGTDTPGLVNGFGAVFVDPDLAFTSSLRFFDKNGNQLAIVHAPIRRNPDEYTFAGVAFNGSVVARIRITLGNAPIDAATNDRSSGGTKDVVVLDDFVYGEPQPVK